MVQCGAVCCSIRNYNDEDPDQVEEVGPSVLQCVAVCCSVVQCVAVCCSLVQFGAVCCSVLLKIVWNYYDEDLDQVEEVGPRVLQCVDVCCSVLKFSVWSWSELSGTIVLQFCVVSWSELSGNIAVGLDQVE